MIRTSISITIIEWNICDCPGKSRTYGTKTPEALMTWMRITMTLVFLWVSTPEFWVHQSPPHPGAFACNLSSPKPASLIRPFSHFRSQHKCHLPEELLWNSKAGSSHQPSFSLWPFPSQYFLQSCSFIVGLHHKNGGKNVVLFTLHSLHLVPSRE